jgi:hypothetical protein
MVEKWRWKIHFPDTPCPLSSLYHRSIPSCALFAIGHSHALSHTTGPSLLPTSYLSAHSTSHSHASGVASLPPIEIMWSPFPWSSLHKCRSTSPSDLNSLSRYGTVLWCIMIWWVYFVSFCFPVVPMSSDPFVHYLYFSQLSFDTSSYSAGRLFITGDCDALRPFFEVCLDHIWACDLLISSRGPRVFSYLVTGHCQGSLLYKDVGTYCIL